MADDRHRRLRRARPLLALAGVAFAIGVLIGASGSGASRYALARSFVAAWARGDYASMYGAVEGAARAHSSPVAFADSYRSALRTATAVSVQVTGSARSAGGSLVAVPVLVRTRLFGTLHLRFLLPVVVRAGEGARIAWSPSLAFPGLEPGEQLGRATRLAPRATVLARDGSVLAEGSGEGRSSPLGSVASAVLGQLGQGSGSRRAELEAEGVPSQGWVGVSGLELALDERLRGTAGGELLAASPGGATRVLAAAAPRAARPVRSSVSPALQSAAVVALGNQYGGIVVLRPSTGEILAVAGIGLDGLQPPGSTFKMVTVSGVLEAGLADPRSSFPYATYATLDGVKLSNANGEECGGSLELAFAVSCNSAFAPLGVRLGAGRLVASAERLGFNQPPPFAGAAESTLPPASQIQGELALGSSAIGQGRVLATPLAMATVAATIADGGMRLEPSFSFGGHRARVRALAAPVARTVRHLMIGVVRFGTGTAASIRGVVVAGKTGTAELGSRCREPAGKVSASETCQGATAEASNTDAWFAAFAPARHPRIAVCVLLVKDGAGGATAAPVARQVLEAGLQAGV